MVKETSKQASNEKPKGRSVSAKQNVKKLVKKTPSESVKKQTVKSVKSVKSVVKTEPELEVKSQAQVESSDVKVSKVVKPVVNRKFNNKPILAKTMGINISPAKVKNIISNYVLNKDAYQALKELKNAKPSVTTKLVDGKEVSEETKGMPVSSLSKSTQDYISHAEKVHDSIHREEYAKTKIALIPDNIRKEYILAKNNAREEHDKKNLEQYLNNSCSTFDVEQFNSNYIPNFYDEYNATKAASDLKDNSDEWKKAMDKITKLKNRFSTNSRVFLSAFVECIVKQLSLNGTVCCVADNKKIIQLSHVLDTKVPGFEERFPLYPLIVNLDTFKQAQKYLANPGSLKTVEDLAETSESSSDEKVEESDKKVKVEKDNDLFKLDGVSSELQYQFRYYIAETCRETRIDLANTEVDSSGNLMSVYNYTSVSKVFKNFCSTLVCEFLMRIGVMIKKEIETRGIKTVNDNIVGTVISHYHIVSGVDETKTVEFIRNVTSRYYKYINDRQQKRKDNKPESSVDPAVIKYEE